MLIPEDVQDEVRSQWSALAEPVQIRLDSRGSDQAANETMRTLWTELAALSAKLTWIETPVHDAKFLPSQEKEQQGPVSEVWMDNQFTGIRYLGIPSGHEFGGLIETINALSTGSAPHITEATRLWLEGLEQDLHLGVFVTPT